MSLLLLFRRKREWKRFSGLLGLLTRRRLTGSVTDYVSSGGVQVAGASGVEVATAVRGGVTHYHGGSLWPWEHQRVEPQVFEHVASGGLRIGGKSPIAAVVSVLARGGIAISGAARHKLVRNFSALAGCSKPGGTAEVSVYDAIYESEDEEVMLLAA